MTLCCWLTRSVGEKRRLKVPAHLAYQDKGHPDLGVPGDYYFPCQCMQEVLLNQRLLWRCQC